MNLLRMIQRTSPIGLFIGGVAIALSIPPIRRTLRTAAIAATGTILSITEEAKNFTANSKQQLQDIVEEGTSDECCQSCSDFKQGLQDLANKPRDLAVAATSGVLTISDKAKELYKNTTEEVQSIIEDARERKNSSEITDIEEDFEIDSHPPKH